MANNSLTFTSPASGVTFTLTAALAPDGEVHAQTFTATSPAGDDIYLKVFLTGDNTETEITDYSSLVQGTLYDIKAYQDADFNIPYDVTSWTSEAASFVGATFTPNRKPMA